MSYQVIARKWRPQTFEEMVGQSHVGQTLHNALKSGRIPHALLFTGPRGVGKTSSARILAKSLKCPNAQDFVPCNKCSLCQEISQGNSFDVMEIDGASHNGVDSVRELRETVFTMPAQGRYKIYIIDEVHMLSVAAFNALLKTLEEPPPHVIFIFATTEPQKIPTTILSRVQRFDFRRIPTRLLVERLQLICSTEKVAFEVEALWLIARHSDGSARDSQSLLDQMITFGNGKITLQQSVEILGLTDRGLILETLQALIERSVKRVIDVTEKIYTSGQDSKIFLQDLLEQLRNLLLIKATPDYHRVIDLADSEIENIKSLCEALSQEDIHLLFDMTLKGIQDLQRAPDPKLLLEMLLLRMAAAPRIIDLEKLVQSSHSLPAQNEQNKKPNSKSTEKKSEKPIKEALKPQPAPIEKKEAIFNLDKSSNLVEDWSQIVGHIKKTNPLLGAKLEHVALEKIEGNDIFLNVQSDKSFLIDQFSEKKNIGELKAYLQDLTSTDYNMRFFAKKEPVLAPAEYQLQKKTEKESKIKKEVEEHPLVQKTQKVFKGQIKSIKPIKETL